MSTAVDQLIELINDELRERHDLAIENHSYNLYADHGFHSGQCFYIKRVPAGRHMTMHDRYRFTLTYAGSDAIVRQYTTNSIRRISLLDCDCVEKLYAAVEELICLVLL